MARLILILIVVSALLVAWIDPWHDAVRYQVDPYPGPEATATAVVIDPYPGPEVTATPKAKPEKYQPKPTEDTGWRPTSPPDD